MKLKEITDLQEVNKPVQVTRSENQKYDLEYNLISSKSAAKRINIAPQTLAQWRTNRRVDIPYVKLGRRVMYRQSDLDTFIKNHTHRSYGSNVGGRHE